jgi:plastocyanin
MDNMDLPPQEHSQISATQPSKLKRFWLFAVCVVVVLAALIAAAVWANNSNNPTNKVANVTRTAEISITKDGFVPATLQVPVNTQVTWSNEDDQSHQVAADPYPKDNSIPNFNNKVVLKKADSYSFDFTKAGTYTYHDENNPLSFKGTIIVK